MLKKRTLMPCVVFTFSKKRCESNADALASADWTTTSEKSSIQVFYDQAVARLKGTDRDLPQVCAHICGAYGRCAVCMRCSSADWASITVACYPSSRRWLRCYSPKVLSRFAASEMLM